ncbi:MAG TPA: hypothetical protein VE262_24520 [Blastocatellia bacterium]|nr:hypothetical protein [Blastocatellia bacterium]
MTDKKRNTKQQPGHEHKKRSGIAPRTGAEWVSLIISLVLLLLVVGTVVALWLNPSGNPARFRIDRGAIRSEGDVFYLPVIVSNDGDATGAQVTVSGKLEADGEEEEASTTFDFIPGHSSAEATLVFSKDPVSAEVRVTSYQNP